MTPNLSDNDKDETFSLEIFKHNKVKVCATINKKFYEIKNHIGDMHSLKTIRDRKNIVDESVQTSSDNDLLLPTLISSPQDRDEINSFKKLVKFSFEHLSKACTDQEALLFNSTQMKVKNRMKKFHLILVF